MKENVFEKVTPIYYLFILFFLFPHFYSPTLIGGGFYSEIRYLFYFASLSFLSVLLLNRVNLQLPFKPVWGFVLLSLVPSLSGRVNLKASLEGLLLFLSYLACFSLAFNFSQSNQKREALVKILLISGFLLSLYGLWQFIIGFSLLKLYAREHGILAAGLQSRVFSIFTSPNIFASLLILLFFPAFYFYIREPLSRKNWWAGSVILIYLVTLFLTFSRGALVAFALSLILFLLWAVWQRKWAWFPKLIFVLVIGLALTVAFYFLTSLVAPSSPPGQALSSAVEVGSAQVSLARRVELWQSGLKMLREKPLFGFGLNSFSTILPQFQVSDWYSRFTHNYYLEWATGVGFLGLLLLLTLLFVVSFNLYSSFKEESLFHLFLLFGFFGFLFHNLVDYSLNIPLVGLVFWTLAGLGVKAGKTEATLPRFYGLPLLVLALVSLPWLGSHLLVQGSQNLAHQGQFEGALNLTKLSTALNPVDANYYRQLCQLHLQVAQLGTAEANVHYKEALNAALAAAWWEPQTAFNYYLLGLTNEKLGQFRESLKNYRKALELYPNNPLCYRALAEFWMRQSDWERARFYLQKSSGLITLYGGRAYTDRPEDPAYHFRFIYVDLSEVARQENDFDSALVYAGYSLELSNYEFYEGWLARAKAQLGLGQIAEAVYSINKALKISELPEAYFIQGQAYVKLKKKRKAETAFRKALVLSPNFKEARLELEKLQGGEGK